LAVEKGCHDITSTFSKNDSLLTFQLDSYSELKRRILGKGSGKQKASDPPWSLLSLSLCYIHPSSPYQKVLHPVSE